MQTVKFKQGVKYRGYGYLNEYGEFEFVPEQKGIREGRIRPFKMIDNCKLSLSDDNLLIHIKIKRRPRLNMMQSYLQTSNFVMNIINTYEF